MFNYQLIIIILCIISLLFSIKRYNDQKITLGICITWDLLAILVIIATVFPQISMGLANIVGLGRGLDALYIIALFIILYILFKLYNMIEDQKRRINELISQLAIHNHKENDDE